MNNNKIKIINDDEYDDDLSYGYNKFISFLNNNENWNDIKKLNNIFNKENNIKENENNLYKISFYLSDIDGKKNDDDGWFDIN